MNKVNNVAQYGIINYLFTISEDLPGKTANFTDFKNFFDETLKNRENTKKSAVLSKKILAISKFVIIIHPKNKS